VELLFKEWKSYANLHAFDTEKDAIVEGVIWAAISAAALKRFLAHATQWIAGVIMSTRTASMRGRHGLDNILRALKTADETALDDGLARAITSLARHATRAHPKRDRRSGRLQLGLEPLVDSHNEAEIKEAA
jgi:hypothetical protein